VKKLSEELWKLDERHETDEGGKSVPEEAGRWERRGKGRTKVELDLSFESSFLSSLLFSTNPHDLPLKLSSLLSPVTTKEALKLVPPTLALFFKSGLWERTSPSSSIQPSTPFLLSLEEG